MAVILLSSSPTEACAYDQADSSDLAWYVEIFESVLASLSWPLLKTPAKSVIERLSRAGVVD